MRILIIDDEPYVEALIKGWFRSSDHELNFLQSGAPLMREDATFVKKYDVVIIDKQLPEVDGLQIGKHLKENYPELVTIMVTGFESTETLVSAFRAHCRIFCISKFIRCSINKISHNVI